MGILGIGVGAYWGFHAKAVYDDATSPSNCPTGISMCNQAGVDGVERARTEAAVSTVAFLAGGALLAGGLVLFLMPSKNGTITVSPSAGGTSLRANW